MSLSWIELAGSVLGGGVAVTVIQTLANRRRVKAEASDVAISSVLKYTESLRERVDKLEATIEEYRKENVQLHKEIAALRTELDFYKTGRLINRQKDINHGINVSSTVSK